MWSLRFAIAAAGAELHRREFGTPGAEAKVCHPRPEGNSRILNSSECADRSATSCAAASATATRRGLAVQGTPSVRGEEVVSGRAEAADVVVAMNELTAAVTILAERTMEGVRGGPTRGEESRSGE